MHYYVDGRLCIEQIKAGLRCEYRSGIKLDQRMVWASLHKAWSVGSTPASNIVVIADVNCYNPSQWCVLVWINAVMKS